MRMDSITVRSTRYGTVLVVVCTSNGKNKDCILQKRAVGCFALEECVWLAKVSAHKHHRHLNTLNLYACLAREDAKDAIIS